MDRTELTIKRRERSRQAAGFLAKGKIAAPRKALVNSTDPHSAGLAWDGFKLYLGGHLARWSPRDAAHKLAERSKGEPGRH